MKKTIKILAEKMKDLQEQKDGKLQGGFASIKGGFHAADDGTNVSIGYTNTHNCLASTNLYGCTNSGVCFA